VTVLVISHEMSDVFEVADVIVVLYQGKLVAVKKKSETSINEVAQLIITGQGHEQNTISK
jgi:ABC-type sugar transport system ATPase subunit